MDRQRIRSILVRGVMAALLWLQPVLSGCGQARARGQRLAPDALAQGAATDLRRERVVAKNALAYHVALSEQALVSVELTTQFELVVRARPGESSETRRYYVDQPSYDVLDLVLSPDGEFAYLASAAGWLRRYALADGSMQEWRVGSAVTALAISEDGAFLALGTDRGTVCLRRLQDGALLQCMVAHRARIGALAVRGNTLASASWNGELATWSMPAMSHLGGSSQGGSIAAISLAPGGQTLAVARNLHPPVRTPEIAKREERSPKIHRVGDNTIELWALNQGKLADAPVREFRGHRSIITGLDLGEHDLASVSWDGSLRLWPRASGENTTLISRIGPLLQDLARTPSGGHLATAGWGTKAESPAICWIALYFPMRRSR